MTINKLCQIIFHFSSSIHQNQITLLIVLLFASQIRVAKTLNEDKYSIALTGKPNQVNLVPETKYSGDGSKLITYCKPGYPRKSSHAWAQSYIWFSNESKVYDVVDGKDIEEVNEKVNNGSSLWRSFVSLAQPKNPVVTRTLAYFEARCLTVITDESYQFTYQSTAFDPFMFGLTLLGIIAFYKAPSYSRSETFFYLSSLILGCLGSLLVILLIISRFVPKKLYVATIIFGCSSIGFIYHMLKDKIVQQIWEYGTYVIWYIGATALITFAFAYRFGPPSHPKTLRIVQWACQLVSLGLITISISLPPITVSLITIIVLHYNFSSFWTKLPFRRRQPIPARPLLTEEEYINQGIVHTHAELSKLREYCRSPEVDPWHVIYKLKNPERFAKFIVTGEDVGEAERTIYDTSAFDDSDEILEDMDTGDTMMMEEEIINSSVISKNAVTTTV